MSDYAPPIPDDVFWPAWAEAEGYKKNACKLLRIGMTRLNRELALRGLQGRISRRHKPAPHLTPDDVRCAVCGDRVEPGLPWGSNGKPDRHWTCEEWECGRVVLFDGPLKGLINGLGDRNTRRW